MEVERMSIESHIEMKGGVLHNIPVNCTFHHSKVDLATLEARRGDANMIIELLVILTHSIAQKHEKVSAAFSIIRVTVGTTELMSYIINFHMPNTVRVNFKQQTRLKKVNPYRVVNIEGPYPEDGVQEMRITVDSNDNPFDRVAYLSSHLEIESLGMRHDDLYTSEVCEEDKRGATKRKRKPA